MGSFDFFVGNRKGGHGLPDEIDGLLHIVDIWAQQQVGRITEAFNQGGHQERGGTEWASWSPEYDKRQTRRGRSRILVDKGDLKRSIFSKVSSTGLGFRILLGAGDAKAGWLHFGFEYTGVLLFRPRGGGSRTYKVTMPARPVVEITASDKKKLIKKLNRQLRENLGGND